MLNSLAIACLTIAVTAQGVTPDKAQAAAQGPGAVAGAGQGGEQAATRDADPKEAPREAPKADPKPAPSQFSLDEFRNLLESVHQNVRNVVDRDPPKSAIVTTIQGRVVDAEGEPVAGARILVGRGWFSGETIYR